MASATPIQILPQATSQARECAEHAGASKPGGEEKFSDYLDDEETRTSKAELRKEGHHPAPTDASKKRGGPRRPSAQGAGDDAPAPATPPAAVPPSGPPVPPASDPSLTLVPFLAAPAPADPTPPAKPTAPTPSTASGGATGGPSVAPVATPFVPAPPVVASAAASAVATPPIATPAPPGASAPAAPSPTNAQRDVPVADGTSSPGAPKFAPSAPAAGEDLPAPAVPSPFVDAPPGPAAASPEAIAETLAPELAPVIAKTGETNEAEAGRPEADPAPSRATGTPPTASVASAAPKRVARKSGTDALPASGKPAAHPRSAADPEPVADSADEPEEAAHPHKTAGPVRQAAATEARATDPASTSVPAPVSNEAKEPAPAPAAALEPAAAIAGQAASQAQAPAPPRLEPAAAPSKAVASDGLRPVATPAAAGVPDAKIASDARAAEVTKLATPAAFDRLLEQLRGEIHKGKDEFHLTLDPPELGRVDVNVAARGDGVVLRITAEKSDVAHWLRTDLPILHKAIEKDGLQVLGVEVRSWLDQAPHGRDQHANQHPEEADAGAGRSVSHQPRRAAHGSPHPKSAAAAPTTSLDLIV